MPTLLSILMPLYNEEEYLGTILDRVLDAPLPVGADREIVLVDDGSRDGSVEIARRYEQRYPGIIRLICHERNQGKGAAIRTAIQQARGEFSIIQDADLEYDPAEYPNILNPLFQGKADVVYGSRFVLAGERRVLYFWHSIANHVLTTACNFVCDLNLTDMETCYKAFRTSLAQSIPLRSNRFGLEPEITIKFAKRHAVMYETPISYYGRTYEEGKKIGLKDAFQAIGVIVKNAILDDIYVDPGTRLVHSAFAAPRFNRWMADAIRPYVGKHVLELGAGIGNLTRELAMRRVRYVASDTDVEHLSRLRNRFRHRPNLEVERIDLASAEAFQPFAGSMESVICINRLEHVEDDVAALRSIHGALQAGGRAIVLVPEGPSIFGSLDSTLGRFRRYTEQDLRQKMESAGFHIEQIVGFNRITRPSWFLLSRVLKRRVLHPYQMKIFDALVPFWRKIDDALPWQPTSLIAIGVKE